MFMTMKTMTINAYSVSDLKKQCPFTLEVNATPAWKKAGCPEGEDLNNFMAEYLTKKKLGIDQGAYIVRTQGVEDTRENPYTIEPVITKGARKMERVYELIDVNTNQILGTAKNKIEAMNLAREVVRTKRGDLVAGVKHRCEIKAVVVEGDPVAFTFEYTPSAATTLGEYFCFAY
jgi:hypothetical protein